MKKAFSTPSWFVLATVYTLLGILFASGSVWAQTATAPGAPTIDSLTTGNESIAVSWTAPASNGGSDITSYDLRHIGSDATDKSDDNWTVEDNVWSSGALQATITGLTNGASYDVQARAINEDRQRLLVPHRLGQGRHRSHGSPLSVRGAQERSDYHYMVEPGQRRWVRGHLLRPALHQERRGRFGRRQLDPQGRFQPGQPAATKSGA